jgi:hypothetical protein
MVMLIFIVLLPWQGGGRGGVAPSSLDGVAEMPRSREQFETLVLQKCRRALWGRNTESRLWPDLVLAATMLERVKQMPDDAALKKWARVEASAAEVGALHHAMIRLILTVTTTPDEEFERLQLRIGKHAARDAFRVGLELLLGAIDKPRNSS